MLKYDFYMFIHTILKMVLAQVCARYFPVNKPSENVHSFLQNISLSAKDNLHEVISTL